MPRVVLASAALCPIPRPSVIVARATSIPPPLAVDVHQPVPVRVGRPGLAVVLEPIVPALVGIQVPDEVVI